MIILLHGTGDDDSKIENWMASVAKIADKHGDLALTIQGVSSDLQGQVGDDAIAFLDKVTAAQGYSAQAKRGVEISTQFPKLKAAIENAGGQELPPVLKTIPLAGAVAALKMAITTLKNGQRNEGKSSAAGIKVRIAIAGLAAVGYYRHSANPLPVRIIGHSRGGATAVGVHNLLTLIGIPCQHTVTLDPCHGQGVFGDGKDYYTKIWTGNLVNIPCVKEVGDTFFSYTRRPPIEKGEGASYCSVTNHTPKLPNIKHGHMGKLRSFESDKEAGRAALKKIIDPIVAGKYDSLHAHVLDLFKKCVPRDNDFEDRKIICNTVLDALK
jgi:hypothetical protein